jgi:Ca2+-binding EF-hand superfamily protein
LTARRQTIDGDGQKQIDEMVETIWDESAEGKTEMTRAECKDFITRFVKSTDHRLEVSNTAFEQIFGILDIDHNGAIDKKELKEFITNFTTGKHED